MGLGLLVGSMKIVFIIYNGMTTLDFIGVFDPVARLRTMGIIGVDLGWDICAFTDMVIDGMGIRIIPDKVRPNLDKYDTIIVPGGLSSRTLIKDEKFMNWIKTADHCPLKISVCSGSLILGAAGFLKGFTATSHPSALEQLRAYCSVSDDRIIDCGDVITSGGVTSGIDLGFYLVKKWAGEDVVDRIRTQMCYDISNVAVKQVKILDSSRE